MATGAAALALTSGLTACGGPVGEGPPPQLIVPSAERLAELEQAVTGEVASVNDPTEIGVAGFTDDTLMESFIKECRELQPKGELKAGAGDRAAASSVGRVFRGDTLPKKLPEVPDDGIFRWVEGNPEYLDPNKISESAGNAIASQMFETLLILPPGNTPVVPGAAESYTVSDDGLVYTFTLREGLTWSDGKPLLAEDFRYSWLRGLAPETGSRNAQQLWFIKGAKAYNTSKSKDRDSVAIRTDGKRKLIVTLEARTPFFPDLVTYIAYAPVPRHAIEKHGEKWALPNNIVVNGPFIMTEWKPRDRLMMGTNDKYWDAANIKLKGQLIYSSDDEKRNVLLYDTGQAHWVSPIGADRIREFKNLGRSDLQIDQIMCTYYYVLRTDKPPFNDPRLRRAINIAVDKERLTQHVLASFEPSTTHLVPNMFRNTLGYKGPEGDAFNPQKARQLLAEAGYPDGKGLPKLELVYNTFEVHRLVAEYVQRNLKENLGVELSLINMEWKSLLKKNHSGDFQISRTSWCADYPDPLTFLAVWDSESENNYAAYKNPAYDKVLDRIRSEGDRVERNALMCAAEKAINRDMPIVPFYYYSRANLVHPTVRGFEAQYLDHHNTKWIHFGPPSAGGSE